MSVSDITMIADQVFHKAKKRITLELNTNPRHSVLVWHFLCSCPIFLWLLQNLECRLLLWHWSLWWEREKSSSSRKGWPRCLSSVLKMKSDVRVKDGKTWLPVSVFTEPYSVVLLVVISALPHVIFQGATIPVIQRPLLTSTPEMHSHQLKVLFYRTGYPWLKPLPKSNSLSIKEGMREGREVMAF